MKPITSWIVCGILGVALVVTNYHRIRLYREEVPPDLAPEFGDDSRWVQLYKNNRVAIWRSPAYGSNDCSHGESFAVVHDNRLSVLCGDGPGGISVYQEGRLIANLLLRNKMYDSLRMFYITGKDGEEYQLIDFDGDGIIDTKSEDEKYWIYKHGEFLEMVYTTRHERVKQLLDGSFVTLKDGRWVEAEEGER